MKGSARGAYEQILALVPTDEPPAPTLLPWIARGAAEDDLLHIARVAAAQYALAPMRRWPAVTDATAEVLSYRRTERRQLVSQLVDVLPPVMAYLDEGQAADLVSSGARPDAAAYAALGHPSGCVRAPMLESLHSLWREVLAPERTDLPPLASLRLLARLAAGPTDIAGFSASEVIYLLPFIGVRRADDVWAEMAVTEIRDYLQADGLWYAAALFARAAPYLDSSRRSQVRSSAAELPPRWARLFDDLSRKARSPWKSAVPEITAAHPALAELDRLADEATSEELAMACADIASRMPDPPLPQWEPAAPMPEPEPTRRTRSATVASPDRDHIAQVPLGGPTDEVGAADRAVLPGVSTKYRRLEFKCPRPHCDQRKYQIYYDDRYLPVCDRDGEQMVLDETR